MVEDLGVLVHGRPHDGALPSHGEDLPGCAAGSDRLGGLGHHGRLLLAEIGTVRQSQPRMSNTRAMNRP